MEVQLIKDHLAYLLLHCFGLLPILQAGRESEREREREREREIDKEIDKEKERAVDKELW